MRTEQLTKTGQEIDNALRDWLKMLNGELVARDGYTPVRGTDYYLDSEVDDMKADLTNYMKSVIPRVTD